MSTKIERAQLLRRTSVFDKLSDEECQMLAPVFKDRILKDGDMLCSIGAMGDYMAVVVLGALLIEVEGEEGENTVVATVRAREVVGEMSCLDPLRRSATVRAKGETRVLILSRSMLDEMKADAPRLFSGVVRGIAYRLAGRLDEMNHLISKLLRTKREPTQPRQPSLQELQAGSSSGRSVRERVKLSPTGVMEGLSEREREVLRAAMEPRRYGAGDTICVEGEPAPEAYFVAQGEVDVLRTIGAKTYRLATCEVGSCLGQRSLLREGTRSATLRAGQRGVTLLCLSRDRFNALLEAKSDLAIGFQEAVTIAGIRQLRQANEMAAYLGAREEKGKFPRPISSARVQMPPREKTIDERLAEMVEIEMEEADHIEALASAYLNTALEDWEVTPSELDKIELLGLMKELSAQSSQHDD